MPRLLPTASALLCALALSCSGGGEDPSDALKPISKSRLLDGEYVLEAQVYSLDIVPDHERWQSLLERAPADWEQPTLPPALVLLRADDRATVRGLIEILSEAQRPEENQSRHVLGVLLDSESHGWEIPEFGLGLGLQPLQTTYQLEKSELNQLYVFVDPENRRPTAFQVQSRSGPAFRGREMELTELEWPVRRGNAYYANLLDWEESMGAMVGREDRPIWVIESMTVREFRSIMRISERYSVELLGLQLFRVNLQPPPEPDPLPDEF